MRRTAATAVGLGLVALLALTGCGPSHGTVYDKRHTAASTSSRRSCSGHGHHRHCRQVPVHHREKWELCIQDGGRKGCRSVSSTTYNKYAVGQQYP
jgi:hypothetical protein